MENSLFSIAYKIEKTLITRIYSVSYKIEKTFLTRIKTTVYKNREGDFVAPSIYISTLTNKKTKTVGKTKSPSPFKNSVYTAGKKSFCFFKLTNDLLNLRRSVTIHLSLLTAAFLSGSSPMGALFFSVDKFNSYGASND